MMEQSLRQKARLKAHQPAVAENVDMTSFYITAFCLIGVVAFLVIGGFIKVVVPYIRQLTGM